MAKIELKISIPGNIQPFERGLFLDPLDDALNETGLGEIFEEGTLLKTENGKQSIIGCEAYIEVNDLTAGLAMIRKILRPANLPPETTITVLKGAKPAVFSLHEAKSDRNQ